MYIELKLVLFCLLILLHLDVIAILQWKYLFKIWTIRHFVS